MKRSFNIPTPSESEVQKYLDRWKHLDNYVLQESALSKLFNITYPNNKSMDDILIKASSLNDFYSTNIFSIFPVAKHILDCDIDERLRSGDISLVDDLKLVRFDPKEDTKTINFYSFFTKYCSHHERDKFPIYDSYVDKVLWFFQKRDEFSSFKRPELKTYVSYYEIINDFRKFYSLDYGLKDTDRYLWQLGKEFFPRKY